MKARGDGAEGAPPRVALPAGTGELRSTLLLPLLLERFDPEQPLMVLDVGYGAAETVEFFSRYRCRLQFAGMIDAPEFAAVPEEEAEAYLDQTFARLCAFPPETRFDVCLLWDFLNYLPVPGLRAFSRALRPYLHRQTHAHGFGAFKATAPSMAKTHAEAALRYSVYDVDKLLVRPRPGGAAPGHSHSRAVLADALGCFEIVRGTLLKEGTMELLLQAR
jgi:hypothetical protein